MKKIFLVLVLLSVLLVVGCATQIEEPIDGDPLESITGDVVAEPTIEKNLDSPPLYHFEQGESKIIEGKTITINTILQPAHVDITVGSVGATIEGTKNDEVINGLRISIQTFNYDVLDHPNNYVEIKVEKLVLEDNQYLINKGEKLTVGEKDIILELAKMDGSIIVDIFDAGKIQGENDVRIKNGETVEGNGVSIKNIEQFYSMENYAIVEINLLEE